MLTLLELHRQGQISQFHGLYVTWRDDSKGFNIFEVLSKDITASKNLMVLNLHTRAKFPADPSKLELFWLQKGMLLKIGGLEGIVEKISGVVGHKEDYSVDVNHQPVYRHEKYSLKELEEKAQIL